MQKINNNQRIRMENYHLVNNLTLTGIQAVRIQYLWKTSRSVLKKKDWKNPK